MQLKRQRLKTTHGVGFDDHAGSVLFGAPTGAGGDVLAEILTSKNFVARRTHDGHCVEN